MTVNVKETENKKWHDHTNMLDAKCKNYEQ